MCIRSACLLLAADPISGNIIGEAVIIHWCGALKLWYGNEVSLWNVISTDAVFGL